VKKFVLILALLALVAMTPSVRAQAQIDFSTGAAAMGTASYSGGSSPLAGSNLTVTELAGKNVPLSNFIALAITSGLLDFSTGPSNGSWSWGAGGSFSIMGTINAQTPAGGSAFGGTSGTLLSGTVVSATLTSNGNGPLLTNLGVFVTSINSAILSYYGLQSTPHSGGFFLSFSVQGGANAPDAFTSTTIGSGDLTTVVPAPGFLVLLCSGGAVSLLGCACRRAKKVAG
jgi:hypothetical protein